MENWKTPSMQKNYPLAADQRTIVSKSSSADIKIPKKNHFLLYWIKSFMLLII